VWQVATPLHNRIDWRWKLAGVEYQNLWEIFGQRRRCAPVIDAMVLKASASKPETSVLSPQTSSWHLNKHVRTLKIGQRSLSSLGGARGGAGGAYTEAERKYQSNKPPPAHLVLLVSDPFGLLRRLCHAHLLAQIGLVVILGLCAIWQINAAARLWE